MSFTATLTDTSRNQIRDWLKTQIKYIAIGTSTTTPTTSDIRLGNEVLRKPITAFTNGTSPGEFIASMYIGAGELVGVTIEEIGVFMGSSATSSPNTGTLIARGLFHHANKLNTESIIAQLDLTV
jgi:hypothetical protein